MWLGYGSGTSTVPISVGSGRVVRSGGDDEQDPVRGDDLADRVGSRITGGTLLTGFDQP